MQAHLILAIGLKLFSLVLLSIAVRYSPYIFEVYRDGGINGMEASLGPIFSSVLVPLLLAGLFWFFPVNTARSLIPPESDKSLIGFDVQSLFVVLIIVLGLYVLSYAISDIIYWAIALHLANPNDPVTTGGFAFSGENKASVVATIFEVAFGVYLTFKPKSLAQVLMRVAR